MEEIIEIMAMKLYQLFVMALDLLFLVCLFQQLTVMDRQVLLYQIIATRSHSPLVICERIMVLSLLADLLMAF